MRQLDVPNVTYQLTAFQVRDALAKVIKSMKCVPRELRAQFLTRVFDQFYDKTAYVPPLTTVKKSRVPNDDVTHSIKLPFKKKILSGLFDIPTEKSSVLEYRRILIKPSSIKAAGMGAYALDAIPKGARGFYHGEPKHLNDCNVYYSWSIYSYDPETGDEDNEKRVLFTIDASDYRKSNWTRYVNCGLRQKNNNFEAEQEFDTMTYVALRDIKPGEELFIDYGEAYRTNNLKLRGTY